MTGPHPAVNVDEVAGWVSRQLDIDECAAGEATPGPWGFGSSGVLRIYQFDGRSTPIWYGDTVVEMVGDEADPAADSNATHIVLHDPQLVLAQVKANRLLLARLDAERRGTNEHRHRPAGHMIRLMAYGYRHRPGWRAEWEPT